MRSKSVVVMLTVLAVAAGCSRRRPSPSHPDAGEPLPAYKDPALPFEARAWDLVRRMTIEEKVAQMTSAAPAIERLGVPAYDWRSECPHGVARAGLATVFPQPIGLGATWDADLVALVASLIADEARAKHHQALREGRHDRYFGLTFSAPDLDVSGDPRWSHGQETYGEDPYLVARLGVAFARGLQGTHSKYLELVAAPGHFAAHFGSDPTHRQARPKAEARDLKETYLPPFEAVVREARAGAITAAAGGLDGRACGAGGPLLRETLRRGWGFAGPVLSDCGLEDAGKRSAAPDTRAAAAAAKAGCDLDCAGDGVLVQAVKDGLLTEADIDRNVTRLFLARFRLGMFDPPESMPFTRIKYDVVDSRHHRDTAQRVARESIVLLKNEGGLLPLKPAVKTVAVIGPAAAGKNALLGGADGASSSVDILAGVHEAMSARKGKVVFAPGCEQDGRDRSQLDEAVVAARQADVAILALGGAPGPGDGLPAVQEELLRAVAAAGKPVVLVLVGGSALAIGTAKQRIPAIVAAFYPGQAGGTAIADVLFGAYNPAGRLPVTFYRSAADLPPVDRPTLEGRTYRFFKGQPLYPFGHGLSYTQFRYSNLRLKPSATMIPNDVLVEVDVENVGALAGDEVVQLYLKDEQASVRVPVHALQGFRRVSLAPSKKATVVFRLLPRQLAVVDDAGRYLVEPGWFTVAVGGGQPDRNGKYAAGAAGVTGRLELYGKATEVK